MLNNFLNNPCSFIRLNPIGIHTIVDSVPVSIKNKLSIKLISSKVFEILSANKVYAPKLFNLNNVLNLASYIRRLSKGKELNEVDKINTVSSIFILIFAFSNYRKALMIECIRKIQVSIYCSVDDSKNVNFHLLNVAANAIHVATLVHSSPRLHLVSIISQVALNSYQTYQTYHTYQTNQIYPANKPFKFPRSLNLTGYTCIDLTLSSTLVLFQNRKLFKGAL